MERKKMRSESEYIKMSNLDPTKTGNTCVKEIIVKSNLNELIHKT